MKFVTELKIKTLREIKEHQTKKKHKISRRKTPVIAYLLKNGPAEIR
jgi:hypothetical protein